MRKSVLIMILFFVLFLSNKMLLTQNGKNTLDSTFKKLDCSCRNPFIDTLFYYDTCYDIVSKSNETTSILSFENLTIQYPILLINAELVNDFSKVIFIRNADFSCASFTKSTTFETVIFNDVAYFVLTDFLDSANFVNCRFSEGSIFLKADFMEFAIFDSCVFNYKGIDNANFSFVSCNKSVCFRDCQFKTSGTFANSEFHGDSADFTGSEFSGKVLFDNSLLPKNLILNNVKTEEIIDLTSARINGDTCKIYLMDFDLEKIRFYYDHFCLSFQNDSTPINRKTQLYIRLLEKFKKEGQTECYEKLFIEYKKFKYSHVYKSSFWGFVNFLEKWGWGYGFEKWRIWYCFIILFLGLYIINLFVINYQNNFKMAKTNEFEFLFPSFLYPFVFNKKDKLIVLKKTFHNTSVFYFGVSLNFDVLKEEYPEIEKVPVGIYIISLLTYIIGLIAMGFFLNSFVTAGPNFF